MKRNLLKTMVLFIPIALSLLFISCPPPAGEKDYKDFYGNRGTMTAGAGSIILSFDGVFTSDGNSPFQWHDGDSVYLGWLDNFEGPEGVFKDPLRTGEYIIIDVKTMRVMIDMNINGNYNDLIANIWYETSNFTKIASGDPAVEYTGTWESKFTSGGVSYRATLTAGTNSWTMMFASK